MAKHVAQKAAAACMGYATVSVDRLPPTPSPASRLISISFAFVNFIIYFFLSLLSSFTGSLIIIRSLEEACEVGLSARPKTGHLITPLPRVRSHITIYKLNILLSKITAVIEAYILFLCEQSAFSGRLFSL